MLLLRATAAQRWFEGSVALKWFIDLPSKRGTLNGYEMAKFNVPERCVPKKGRRNEAEAEREHSAWFKMGQAFRAGIEGTISVLKRVYGWNRCLREGWEHFQSWVGTGVLAHNLVQLTRR